DVRQVQRRTELTIGLFAQVDRAIRRRLRQPEEIPCLFLSLERRLCDGIEEIASQEAWFDEPAHAPLGVAGEAQGRIIRLGPWDADDFELIVATLLGELLEDVGHLGVASLGMPLQDAALKRLRQEAGISRVVVATAHRVAEDIDATEATEFS